MLSYHIGIKLEINNATIIGKPPRNGLNFEL
jgi:hypothetical protein